MQFKNNKIKNSLKSIFIIGIAATLFPQLISPIYAESNITGQGIPTAKNIELQQAPELSEDKLNEIKDTLDKYFKHEIKTKDRTTNGDIVIKLESGGKLTLIDDPHIDKSKLLSSDPSESVEGIAYQGLTYDNDISPIDTPFTTGDASMIKYINVNQSFEVKTSDPAAVVDSLYARFPEGRIQYQYTFNDDIGLTLDANQNIYFYAVKVFHHFNDESYEYFTPSHYQFVLYSIDK